MPPQAKPGTPAAAKQVRQMSTAQSSQFDGTITKDSFIPLSDGQPSSYQEWRKRINIYHLKMGLQKRKAESVLNIIGSLQGTAWRLVENFDLAKIDGDGTFDELLKVLDKAFNYDARVRLPQDFDAYFTHLSRRPGETLLNYVTDHDEKLRKIEEHGIQIPSEIQGWLLLKKANITKEQRQMIITQAPKLERLKVQEALYLILGQDWKSAVSHDQHRRAGSGRLFRGAYAALDDDDAPEELYEYDEDGYFEYDDTSEYAANDDGWFDDSFDAQAAYYEASEQPEADETFDTDQYDEAFAAYLDTRRRFQDLKLSRGFYPVVALADQGALPAAASSQQPVGKGKGFGGGKSKGKPKGRRKGSSVVKYNPELPMKNADPRGRAAAAMQCLRCGAYGDQAAQCPKPQKHPGPSSQSPSPKKQHTTESMAVMQLPIEDGHVIFEDINGQPRVDCTMMDRCKCFLDGKRAISQVR